MLGRMKPRKISKHERKMHHHAVINDDDDERTTLESLGIMR